MSTPQPQRLQRRSIPELPNLGLGFRSFPAWGVSLILHVLVIIVLGLFWTAVPHGTGGEPDRPAGIAVVYETQGEESYALVDSSDSADAESNAEAAQSALASALAASADSLADANAQRLAELLPGSLDAGSAAESASGGVGLSAGGAGLSGSRDVPKVKTRVFGIEGEGTRFAYVFDRSASMNGYAGAPLAAAKSELLGSIASLGEAHQFQVIFYNESPTAIGSSSGRGAAMLRGTAAEKKSASRYIKQTVASGGTGHVLAMQMALGLGPDVVFFLTDAEDPPASQGYQKVLEKALVAGATVHTIQFGFGPSQSSGGWFKDLAVHTSGQYRYIDLSKLPSIKRGLTQGRP